MIRTRTTDERNESHATKQYVKALFLMRADDSPKFYSLKKGQIIERTLAQSGTSDYVVTVQEKLADDWIRRLSGSAAFLVSASQLSQL